MSQPFTALETATEDDPVTTKDKVDILAHNFGIWVHPDFWEPGEHVAIYEHDDEIEILKSSDFEAAVNALYTKHGGDENTPDIVKALAAGKQTKTSFGSVLI